MHDPFDDPPSIASLAATTDRVHARVADYCRRFIRVALDAADAPSGAAGRPPLRLAIALDRSGSMDGRKMALAQQAALAVIDRLQPTDLFCLVTFSNEVATILPPRLATRDAVADARLAVSQIRASGSTALHGGWEAGFHAVRAADAGPSVARCLLITDGQANVGLQDADGLGRAAAAARAMGVSTSTFGIGEGFDEDILGRMATQGGGNFHYVSDAARLPAILTAELAEVQEIVARDVRLALRPAPGVRLTCLSDYPSTWTGAALEIALGHLAARQQVEVLVDARVTDRGVQPGPWVEVTVADADGVVPLPAAVVAWTMADKATNDQQPFDAAVVVAACQVVAARAVLAALAHHRAQAYAEALAELEAAIGRMRRFAELPAVEAIIRSLRERHDLGRPMDRGRTLALYAASNNMAKSRSADGLARRK